MFGSKDNYFKKSNEAITDERYKFLFALKNIWKLNDKKIEAYLEAFDFFILNSQEYDGATIVNDYWIIPGLDMWAMLHDYIYIKFNVAVNPYYKYLADKLYVQEMRNFKISWGSAWLVRFIGLTLSGIFFIPREKFITKKNFSKENKKEFLNFINKFD